MSGARILDGLNTILEAIEIEKRPHMPDPAKQREYVERHGRFDKTTPFADETDAQIASRVRGLMRTDLLHEPITEAGRDRICRLILQKEALIAAAVAALDYREGALPRRGWMRDNDASRAALDALATAVVKAQGEG